MDGFLVARSLEDDVRFNLAAEAWLLRREAPRRRVLYLWRNSSCVVIGRYQNPWAECRADLLQSEGGRLARRASGGGAVYQDLGNVCFTLASPPRLFSKEGNVALAAEALSELGIRAEASGRNDLLVDGLKVSGNACQYTGDFKSLHGTMLVSSDLGKVSRYLTPPAAKLEAKGIKSVRSRVARLQDFVPSLEPEDFCRALEKVCRRRLGAGVAGTMELSRGSLGADPGFAELLERFSSDEWVYGKTPDFTSAVEGRSPIGMARFLLKVEKGTITGAALESDTLEVEAAARLEALLPGCPYAREAIRALGEGEDGCVRDALLWLAERV